MPNQDRHVYITIECLTHLFREYIGEALIPWDTKAIAIKNNYTRVPGMLGIKMTSSGYTGKEPPEIINFQLHKSF